MNVKVQNQDFQYLKFGFDLKFELWHLTFQFQLEV
jgi:hypothetical protein